MADAAGSLVEPAGSHFQKRETVGSGYYYIFYCIKIIPPAHDPWKSGGVWIFFKTLKYLTSLPHVCLALPGTIVGDHHLRRAS
ncbi:MAG TPA: hypothetical protein VMS81_00940 [Methanomicrobiales archaeon]|nr:hypothetical protein [Methanomicrobiales archaeon]